MQLAIRFVPITGRDHDHEGQSLGWLAYYHDQKMLLRFAQATQQLIASPLAFARLVRANLMHRRRLDRLLERGEGNVINSDQLAIQWR